MMGRIFFAAVLAVCVAGCVSKQEANNGAVRFLNAVPDAPLMRMYVDGELRTGDLDYARGSFYTTDSAGTYPVRIDELLPVAADPNTVMVFGEPVSLDVNDELSLIVVGEAASRSEETVRIRTRARGVPTGNTRVQFVHATAGAPAVDVYVIPPGAEINDATEKIAAGMEYKGYTEQQDLAGGSFQYIVTDAGNKDAVRFNSGTITFPQEVTLLIAIVANTGLDSVDHPYLLTFMTGVGTSTFADKNTQAEVRIVNVSPGDYKLDVILKRPAADDTDRETCTPPTTEELAALAAGGVVPPPVGFCDIAFGEIRPTPAAGSPYFWRINATDYPASATDYYAKVQEHVLRTCPDPPPPPPAEPPAPRKPLVQPLTFQPGDQTTLIVDGVIDHCATSTSVGVFGVSRVRPIATAAQLNLIHLSVAAETEVDKAPTTDRLEIYVTGKGAPLRNPSDPDLDEVPDFFPTGLSYDTGYRWQEAGEYDITLAQTDPQKPDVAPVEWLRCSVTLALNKVYTLAFADRDPPPDGQRPLQLLSLHDDAEPQCVALPAP